jgi:anti-anti-sigma regulatory factor
MLRVQIRESSAGIIFRLEGRFTREGAEHVRSLVIKSKNNGIKLVFDLTELLFVDSVGEEVLLFLRRLGCQVHGRDFVLPGRLRTARSLISA